MLFVQSFMKQIVTGKSVKKSHFTVWKQLCFFLLKNFVNSFYVSIMYFNKNKLVACIHLIFTNYYQFNHLKLIHIKKNKINSKKSLAAKEQDLH